LVGSWDPSLDPTKGPTLALIYQGFFLTSGARHFSQCGKNALYNDAIR